MNKKTVDNYKKSRQPKREPSPEQIKQARERFVNLLAPVVEQMMKSPETIRPVKESWSEIIDGLNNEIAREPVVINHSDGRRIQYDADGSQTPLGVTKSLSGESEKNDARNLTLHNSGGAENSGESILTETDLQILKQYDE